jgi:hypothetical protein
MADVYNRVAMLVDSNPYAQLQMIKRNQIVLKVADSESGVTLLKDLRHAFLQGVLSLGRDNRTWYVTVSQ